VLLAEKAVADALQHAASGTIQLKIKRTPRDAVTRVAQSGTPAEKAKVKAAVKKKYPSIGKSGK
jgi:hypothetical protein